MLALAALRCHLVWPFPQVPQHTLGSVAGIGKVAAGTPGSPSEVDPLLSVVWGAWIREYGATKTPLQAWLHLLSVSPTQPLSEKQAAAQERRNGEKW